MLTLSSFLGSSKFTDYAIKCGQYTFKVHRVIISSRSNYFEKACSSVGFKESAENCITFPEDEPILIARMLLYIYTSDYLEQPNAGNPKSSVTLRNLVSHAAEDKTKVDQDMAEDPTPAILAAQMYVISQKYTINGLGEQSLGRFNAQFFSRREPHLSVSDLIAIVDIVYDGAPDHEDDIRKWVVWRSQVTRKVLNDSAAFVQLLERRLDFARDIVTRYAARNYLWCLNCNEYIDLECCDCGWSGMCGRSCGMGNGDSELLKLSCTICCTRGLLQRARPPTDDDNCLKL